MIAQRLIQWPCHHLILMHSSFRSTIMHLDTWTDNARNIFPISSKQEWHTKGIISKGLEIKAHGTVHWNIIDGHRQVNHLEIKQAAMFPTYYMLYCLLNIGASKQMIISCITMATKWNNNQTNALLGSTNILQSNSIGSKFNHSTFLFSLGTTQF